MRCERIETNVREYGSQSSVNCQATRRGIQRQGIDDVILGEHRWRRARTLAEGWHNLLVP